MTQLFYKHKIECRLITCNCLQRNDLMI